MTTCLLNAIYRHEQAYRVGKRSHYQCSCSKHPIVLEEYEYYETQLPDDSWTSLRDSHFIDWYSDTGPFADRIWMDIPWIIFTHLNMEASTANEDLAYQFRTLEDDEDYEEED